MIDDPEKGGSPAGAWAEALNRPMPNPSPTRADRQFAQSWWDHTTQAERLAMAEICRR